MFLHAGADFTTALGAAQRGAAAASEDFRRASAGDTPGGAVSSAGDSPERAQEVPPFFGRLLPDWTGLPPSACRDDTHSAPAQLCTFWVCM